MTELFKDFGKHGNQGLNILHRLLSVENPNSVLLDTFLGPYTIRDLLSRGYGGRPRRFHVDQDFVNLSGPSVKTRVRSEKNTPFIN